LITFFRSEEIELRSLLEVRYTESFRKIFDKGLIGWSTAVAKVAGLDLLRPCKTRVIIEKFEVVGSTSIAVEIFEFEEDRICSLRFVNVVRGIEEDSPGEKAGSVAEFVHVCDFTNGAKLRTVSE